MDILVYSGDDDVVCATIGSQEWIYDLGFDTEHLHAWRAWKYDDDKYGDVIPLDHNCNGGFVVHVYASNLCRPLPTAQPGTQTGGFTANFNARQMSGNFAFTTAHGCGHEVPTYKPQLALEIFKNYLSGDVFKTNPV